MNTPKNKSKRSRLSTIVRKEDLNDSKLDCNDEDVDTSLAHSTPKHPDSPIYFSSTQEMENEVDWDWQSPLNSTKTKVQKKRIKRLQQKPPLFDVPLKKQTNTINSLKEKLDALNKKIIKKTTVVNNNCTVTEETNLRSIRVDDISLKSKVEDAKKEDTLLDDDDSFGDDILVQCSQQVESEYLTKKDHPVNQVKLIQIQSIGGSSSRDLKFGDDSFDMFLGTVNDDVIETLTQKHDNSSEKTVIQFNTNKISSNQVVTDLKTYRVQTKPVQIPKTNSFEEISPDSCSPPLKCTPEEIEKKRREALAKLERKMIGRPKSSMDVVSSENIGIRKFQKRNHSFELPSPTSSKNMLSKQKSAERINELKDINDWERIQQEIEKKRQEARARLQRKKGIINNGSIKK